MLPVILVLGVSVLLHTKAEQPRLDCHPEPGTNQDECKKRKCIWNETVVHYGQLKILHYNSPCIMYEPDIKMVKEEMTATEHFNMEVSNNSESIFSFKITRPSTKAVIWDTSIGKDIL
ncbi:unnamed protein product [Enterobius vermicularis]|uniref:P-type domain-containing protein n=1 Tax=Enterobius vermicularis TaxID=51028 RepID=A0A0N4VLM9_ENTVE|nr:unnamed protein product [Enterobius vermicularis]